jgi:hypothetical protein
LLLHALQDLARSDILVLHRVRPHLHELERHHLCAARKWRRFAASRRAESVVSSSRDCSSNTGIRADTSVSVPGDDRIAQASRRCS